MKSYPDGTPITRIKLQSPRLTSDIVARPLLLEKLDGGLEKKLTLVSAPAGYGKTTLIASWIQNIPYEAVWTSLEENDNDLLYFLQYLAVAIRGQFPDSFQETLQLAQADISPPPELLVTMFINDIIEVREFIVLAVDDYHLIHEILIREFLSALVAKQPENLHIVLISRTDPLLPLARLRASGQLSEIRAPDLRFEDDLAQLFLEKTSDLSIDHETVKAINTLTEGWITGLRLIVLAASNQQDLNRILADNQSRSVSFINEYLFAEVLERLPELLRTFILRVSILNRFSAQLCDAIELVEGANEKSATFLEWMKNANIFLIPLDDTEEWYRFHQLFQTFLVKELKTYHTEEEIGELHYQASRWFAKEGYVEEAMHHALAAQNVELAASYIEHRSQNLLNSLERRTLARWLSMLPREIIWQRSRLIVAKAWLLFREWRLTAMDEVLADASVTLENEALEEKEKLAIKGQIASLRSLSLSIHHHEFEQSLKQANDALAWLTPQAHGARSVAIGILGVSQQALGDRETAVSFLEKILFSPSHPGPAKIQAFVGLAFIFQATAELVQMRQLVNQFATLATQSKNPNAIAIAHWLAGRLAYERNEIKLASEHFAKLLDFRYRSNFVGTLNAYLGIARIFISKGEITKAQSEIDLLRDETLRLQSGDLFKIVESFQAYLWLIQEDPVPALHWARSIDANSVHESLFTSEVASLTRARIFIEAGSSEEVNEAIFFLIKKLERAQAIYNTFLAIKVRIQLALAYNKISDSGQALRQLEQAVLLAQPGGFIRSFTDAGTAIYPLLTQLHKNGVASDYVREIQASFPQSISKSRDIAAINFDKLLTPRQVEILTLLQKGYSYQEISSNLTISVNTVKKHVSNIYEKLEVSNRQQAIYLAKEMKLIS